MKKVYKKTYNLTFQSAGIDSKLISPIKQYLKFRHKIIHISPLLGILNQEKIHLEDPVFPSEKVKIEALEIFDEFISSFHKATLKLK